MHTNLATGIATGSASAIARTIIAATREQVGEPLLLTVFASTSQPLTDLMPPIAAAFPQSVVLGCSTAGEFTEAGNCKDATAFFALAGDFEIHAGLGHKLADDVTAAVAQALADQPAAVTGYPHRSAILLLDPLAGNSEEATLTAAALLGEGTKLAGGAAGDDLAMEETWVALGAEVASDAVVIASIFSKTPLGVGVCHGHQPFSGPLEVTRSEGNVVHEIDDRPAWAVWKEKTRERALQRGVDPERLAVAEEGAFLLRYEAGLAAGDDYKIRAPLACSEDGAIRFACGIPSGTVVRITESSPERQIESAREAARRARSQMGDVPIAGAIVFDCICRNLILDHDFAAAVKSISEELGGTPLVGFETYGEIALDAGDLSGFHNTTTVVLTFPA